MPASGSSGSLSITNGFDADSQTILQIVRASDTVLEAHVLRGNREITDERSASAFNWTRSSGDATADAAWNNAHSGMKQIALTTAEINGNTQFSCAYTETEGSFGTVQVNDSLVASHTPATADANDVFTIENGMLKVTTSTTNGTDYALNAGTLSVNNGFTGTLSSTATFNNDVQTREIDFIYDHNGMRTAKIVSENGRVETTEYTLHGKLITHMTKRTVDENGTESTEEMHFFYDAQSKPAFVEYDGVMYRYIHNLQGDIVAIVDAAGNLVVEYKYDAWGKPISTTGSLKTTLGELDPFRYRGYVYDEETGMYYLRSRYYLSESGRFITRDNFVANSRFPLKNNLFAYCSSTPVNALDYDGKDAYWITDSSNVGGLGHTSLLVQEEEKWFYFYWGPNLEQPELYAKVYYVEVNISEDDVLGSLNSETDKTEYGGIYDSAILFEGDFSKTAEYCRKLQSRVATTGLPAYGIVDNNCMQVSARAMKESYTWDQLEYWVFRQIVRSVYKELHADRETGC